MDVVPGGTELEPWVKSGCLAGFNPRRWEYNSLLWTEVELNKKASTLEDKSRPCSAGVRLDWTMSSEEGLTDWKAGRYARGERTVYQMRVTAGPESSWSRPLCRT